MDTATVMETRIRPAAIGENRSAVGEDDDEWSKNGGEISSPGADGTGITVPID